MENPKSIFISYSRHDKNVVFPFVKLIEQEFGPVCWIDYKGIESGSQFEEVIVNAIDESKVLLFILSDSSINSKWTKREVLYAEDGHKRIVPIVVDGRGLRKWFRFHFGNVDYIDINEEEQCEKLLDNLATWLETERKSKKVAQNESKIEISADKTVITLFIHNDLKLTLRKDTTRNCYVGEIPVREILEMLKEKTDNLRVSAIGAGVVSSIAGAVCGGAFGILGATVGAIGGYFKGQRYGGDNIEDKVFNDTVSKLNQKYGLHLIKRNTLRSDFIVEMDADREFGLIQPVQ